MREDQPPRETQDSSPPAPPAEKVSPRGISAIQGGGEAVAPEPSQPEPQTLQETAPPVKPEAHPPQETAPPVKPESRSAQEAAESAPEKTDLQKKSLQPTDQPQIQPTYQDTLPNGQLANVYGNPEWARQFNHLEGQNDEKFGGTCGIVSCEDLLRQKGIQTNENELVNKAAREKLCTTDSTPDENGGTTLEQRNKLLNESGLPAHTEVGGNLEQLSRQVKDGRGVIIGANAGYLWNDAGAYEGGIANHAVVVTGVAEHPETGKRLGFFINDSGTNESGKFVDEQTMQNAWVDAGGMSNVTDQPIIQGVKKGSGE